MKGKPVRQIVYGLLSIPGGALMSWLALTGIHLGDYIYRFPYLIILGGALVVLGISNTFLGTIGLVRHALTRATPPRNVYSDPAQRL